jgi:hypothetical protein
MVSEPKSSGVICDGETEYHEEGGILVFDDSLFHSGFNIGGMHRCVLIIDIVRPEGVLPGIATGGATAELSRLFYYTFSP